MNAIAHLWRALSARPCGHDTFSVWCSRCRPDPPPCTRRRWAPDLATQSPRPQSSPEDVVLPSASLFDHARWAEDLVMTAGEAVLLVREYMAGEPETSDVFRAGVLLLLAPFYGMDTADLAMLSGYPDTFVAAVHRRFEENGIWIAGGITCCDWEEECGRVAFLLDAMVGVGLVVRANLPPADNSATELPSPPSEAPPAPADGRARIDWSKYPLGKMSDPEVAKLAKTSSVSVFKARKRLGIPPFQPAHPRKGVDWSAQPVGRVADPDLAKKLGVSYHTVRKVRLRRRIETAVDRTCVCGTAFVAKHGRQTCCSKKCHALARAERLSKIQRGIEENIGLVRKAAGWFRGRGVDYEDLVQEGVFGLMSALRKFDPNRGFKFSTYAMPWIRQALHRAIENTAATIRHPVHIHAKRRKILTTENRLWNRLAREPTTDEVAAELAVSPDALEESRMLHQARAVSMETPLADDFTIADRLVAAGFDAEASIDEERRGSQLHAAIALLAPIERHVLALRFGLADEDELTLDEAGKTLALTRERIRQIEVAAIAKLRALLTEGRAPKVARISARRIAKDRKRVRDEARALMRHREAEVG